MVAALSEITAESSSRRPPPTVQPTALSALCAQLLGGQPPAGLIAQKEEASACPADRESTHSREHTAVLTTYRSHIASSCVRSSAHLHRNLNLCDTCASAATDLPPSTHAARRGSSHSSQGAGKLLLLDGPRQLSSSAGAGAGVAFSLQAAAAAAAAAFSQAAGLGGCAARSGMRTAQ